MNSHHHANLTFLANLVRTCEVVKPGWVIVKEGRPKWNREEGVAYLLLKWIATIYTARHLP